MKPLWCCWRMLLLLCGAAVRQLGADYPPPSPPAQPALLGRHLQRSLGLMATSTPEHRNTVRVLFYGQSITEQKWWEEVAAHLRRQFPHANLIVENRAIGGFASQLLVKTAETDLYSFYPDLLIFHVYGSHIEYENIIRRVRERTTADILMQTDHIIKDEDIREETDPARLTPKQWNAWMNHAFLPQTAAKYAAELCDQHTAWKQYLLTSQLPASALLKDGVHLNGQGEYLMAELVKPYLRYDPAWTAKDTSDVVRTYTVGKELEWREGRLILDFEGNRVDAIAADGQAAPAKVLIDGQPPSTLAELYGLTRTTPYPGSIWPCLLKVGSQSRLQVEEWTLTLQNASEDLKQFSFDLLGSKTGPDGTGARNQRFVSQSGRVVIEPEDWNFDYALKVFQTKLPAGFKISWRVAPHFVDEYCPAGIKDRSVEATVTLAQGLANGKHRLEIVGSAKTPIAALRVYRPPLKTAPAP